MAGDVAEHLYHDAAALQHLCNGLVAPAGFDEQKVGVRPEHFDIFNFFKPAKHPVPLFLYRPDSLLHVVRAGKHAGRDRKRKRAYRVRRLDDRLERADKLFVCDHVADPCPGKPEGL